MPGVTSASTAARLWASVRRRTDHPTLLLLTVAVLWAGFLKLQFDLYGQDISRFVLAGERMVVAAELPAGLSVWPDSWGYDGQFFYRLALEPFTSQIDQYGVPLLPPLYRQQRILYPLLAHLAAGGRPQQVPLALVAVNLAALLALGYLAGCYARQVGRHALLGVALALYPGYMMTLARDLAEIVMAVFLLAGLLAWQRQRPGWAGLALALAVLARETALLLPLGLGLAHLPQLASLLRQESGGRLARLPRAALTALRDRRLLAFALPAVVFLLWQVWLRDNWAVEGLAAFQAHKNFGPPVLGLVDFGRHLLAHPGHLSRVWLIELAVLAALAAVTLLTMRRSQASAGVKLAWAFYLLMLLALNRNVWVEDYAYLRAGTEFYLLSCVVLLSVRGWRAALPMALLTSCWFLLARDLLFVR